MNMLGNDMTLTTQQKYDWLLEQLEVTNIDLWEQDALVGIKGGRLFFQFAQNNTPYDGLTMDEIIGKCFAADAWDKGNIK